MKHKDSWLSLLATCVLLVSGAAFAFAIVLAGASVALAGGQTAEAQEQDHSETVQPVAARLTFSGMITDSRCGARHMSKPGESVTECIRSCVRHGATYVLVNGDRRYTLIGNDSAFAELAGERANISGIRDGDAIIVDTESAVF